MEAQRIYYCFIYLFIVCERERETEGEREQEESVLSYHATTGDGIQDLINVSGKHI